MVALEFVDPDAADPLTPDAAIVKRVLAEALIQQADAAHRGSFGQVVRLIPPLVTTPDEVDLALGIIGESLVAAGA